MLPERRKTLLIYIAAFILFVILIISMWSISKYFKNRHKKEEEKIIEKRNDNYNSLYDYVGILKDSDGVYRIYGIKDNKEDNLGVKTFYDIVNSKIVNKKLVFYSDATNELRYDNKEEEFYLYEVDSKYDKNLAVYFANDYLVYKDLTEIYYKKSDNNDINYVTDNNISKNIVVTDNSIYYQDKNGINVYNIKDKVSKLLFNGISDNPVDLLKGNDKYLMYSINDLVHIKSISDSDDYLLNDKLNAESDITIIDFNNEMLLYSEGNAIKKFDLKNKVIINYDFTLNYSVVNAIKINDSKYFMNVQNDEESKSVIVDINKKELVKEYKNNYLFIGELNED